MTGKAGARFEAASQDTGSVVLVCSILLAKEKGGALLRKRDG
jgi:hypothetical protein